MVAPVQVDALAISRRCIDACSKLHRAHLRIGVRFFKVGPVRENVDSSADAIGNVGKRIGDYGGRDSSTDSTADALKKISVLALGCATGVTIRGVALKTVRTHERQGDTSTITEHRVLGQLRGPRLLQSIRGFHEDGLGEVPLFETVAATAALETILLTDFHLRFSAVTAPAVALLVIAKFFAFVVPKMRVTEFQQRSFRVVLPHFSLLSPKEKGGVKPQRSMQA